MSADAVAYARKVAEAAAVLQALLNAPPPGVRACLLHSEFERFDVAGPPIHRHTLTTSCCLRLPSRPAQEDAT